MIYLLRSFGRGGKSFLKIGFTDDITQRMSNYFYISPGCEVVSVREGDKLLESLLHFYLRYLGFQYKKNGKLNEWFNDSPEIYQIFHIHQRTLEKLIWKNRDLIFNKEKLSLSFQQTLDFKIFSYLFEKNLKTFVCEKVILRDGVVVRTKAKDVDIAFWKKYRKSADSYTLRELDMIPEDLEDSNKEYEKKVQDFLDLHFYQTGVFEEKMKMYCDFMDSVQGNKGIEDLLYFKIKDDRFRKYYRFYGTSGCRSKSYVDSKLYEGIFDFSKREEFGRAIHNFFKTGERYTKKEIKSGLEVIYRDLGITSRKPRTSDLGRYFKLTRTRITNHRTGKLDEGYRLGPL